MLLCKCLYGGLEGGFERNWNVFDKDKIEIEAVSDGIDYAWNIASGIIDSFICHCDWKGFPDGCINCGYFGFLGVQLAKLQTCKRQKSDTKYNAGNN